MNRVNSPALNLVNLNQTRKTAAALASTAYPENQDALQEERMAR